MARFEVLKYTAFGGVMRKLLFFTGWLTLATIAFAQSPTGTIRGTVVDPTGAAVPGASINLTNLATSQIQSAKTDNAGRYILNFVPPGTYSETVTAAGF